MDLGNRRKPELQAHYRRSRCRYPRTRQRLAARDGARRSVAGARTPPARDVRGPQNIAATPNAGTGGQHDVRKTGRGSGGAGHGIAVRLQPARTAGASRIRRDAPTTGRPNHPDPNRTDRSGSAAIAKGGGTIDLTGLTKLDTVQ